MDSQNQTNPTLESRPSENTVKRSKCGQNCLPPDQQQQAISTTGPYTSSPTSTEDLLISKVTHIIHSLNTRNYDVSTYANIFSPHLRIDHNGIISTGIDRAIQAYKWVSDINPMYHVAILEAAAVVYEESGRATVLCTLDMTNCSDETIRAGQLNASWKREKGRGWICWKWEMVLGIRTFF